MWVTKLLISPVKIFCPKTTKFGPKLAFSVNLGQAMQALLAVPFWWVHWWLWRAGCISQDTYLLYRTLLKLLKRGFVFMSYHSCSWKEGFCSDNISLKSAVAPLRDFVVCQAQSSLFNRIKELFYVQRSDLKTIVFIVFVNFILRRNISFDRSIQ